MMFSSSQFDSTSTFTSSQLTQPNDAAPSPAKVSLTFGVFKCLSLSCLASEKVWENGNCRLGEERDGVLDLAGRDTHGLIPVTVKQISEADHSGDEKANFVINGIEAANVTLVGMVFEKTERNTDVSFFLDDGTGRIQCRRWVNESFDAREMEGIQDGMYVRVNGHLKIFQGSRQLGAFSVRPVTKFDEISFHFIECIHNHVKSSKSQQGNSVTLPQPADASLSTPVRSGSHGYQTSSLSQLSGQISFDGQKGCDQLILDYLQLPSSRKSL
ncbi:hypothetical protein TIFTF001_009053 [Ficus carica]|uniref:OB domain-containing protein n=1 Tax=Ficus carica TaxID=3494 RepID=A0AA87ZUK9_FICCA|nr:hypothetical protein TIFTF001_009053 [Ficus carica]